jgi:hypothetical protein
MAADLARFDRTTQRLLLTLSPAVERLAQRQGYADEEQRELLAALPYLLPVFVPQPKEAFRQHRQALQAMPAATDRPLVAFCLTLLRARERPYKEVPKEELAALMPRLGDGPEAALLRLVACQRIVDGKRDGQQYMPPVDPDDWDRLYTRCLREVVETAAFGEDPGQLFVWAWLNNGNQQPWLPERWEELVGALQKMKAQAWVETLATAWLHRACQTWHSRHLDRRLAEADRWKSATVEDGRLFAEVSIALHHLTVLDADQHLEVALFRGLVGMQDRLHGPSGSGQGDSRERLAERMMSAAVELGQAELGLMAVELFFANDGGEIRPHMRACMMAAGESDPWASLHAMAWLLQLTNADPYNIQDVRRKRGFFRDPALAERIGPVFTAARASVDEAEGWRLRLMEAEVLHAAGRSLEARAILEQVPLGVDPQADCCGLGRATMFGRSREVLGREIDYFLGPDAAHLRACWDLVLGPQPIRLEQIVAAEEACSDAATRMFVRNWLLVAACGGDVAETWYDNRPPVWYVAGKGDAAMVGYLLDHDPAAIHFRDRTMPLLFNAVFGNRAEVAGVLLDRGADINERDRRGRTALDCAVDFARVDLVRLLRVRGGLLGRSHAEVRSQYASRLQSWKRLQDTFAALDLDTLPESPFAGQPVTPPAPPPVEEPVDIDF